jgi:predicted nucleotidyltransferase
VDFVASVRSQVERHPAVTSLELVGSRARGDSTELSDWDFLVGTADVETVAGTLPTLASAADPLAAQWDRVSEEASYFMLVLRDGTKVDFVLQRPPDLQPPWVPAGENLHAVDAHFWDWILWLGGKQLRGDDALVQVTLRRLMYDHLLAPLGATSPPATIGEAVELYRSLRAGRERDFGVTVARDLDAVVSHRLASAGVS